jgi:hypothetical protein
MPGYGPNMIPSPLNMAGPGPVAAGRARASATVPVLPGPRDLGPRPPRAARHWHLIGTELARSR